MKDNLEQHQKSVITHNVKELEENLNNILHEFNVDDIQATSDMLSKIDVEQIQLFDYEKSAELILIDAKETLNCLANLYLAEENLENKNISVLIKNDATAIADLNFSISCAKRALMYCMRQIDLGTTNPEMFESVTLFQKEMRETIKSLHDLLHIKMKEFYKTLKEELDEINTGKKRNADEEETQINHLTTTKVVDTKMLNDILESYKKDHTLLQNDGE